MSQTPVTYEAFTAQTPMFFWKDPFGRLIRYINADYVPPMACEPIIYLYPRDTTSIKIAVEPPMRLASTLPEHHSGWEVVANPNGTLIDLATKTAHDSLFWEGVAGLLPQPQTGFVVAYSQLEAFLTKTLNTLGLNQKEMNHFITAWLSQIAEHPFYRLGFYEQQVIDAYAPLAITPKPDTSIRILMDYQRLNKPIQLAQPELTPAPTRKGFTIVEWGFLKR